MTANILTLDGRPVSFTINRDRYGHLGAETRIALGFDRREMRINTGKGSRGVECDATVGQISEDGRGWTVAFAFGGGGDDFRRTVTRGDSRATAAAIERTHTAALQGLADLLREACLHYGKPWAGGSLAAAVASVPGVAV